MVKCSVYRCNSDSSNKNPGLTFHRFPKDEKLKKAWIVNMQIKPTPSGVLCSKHFEQHLLDPSVFRTRLRPGSIPTLLNGLPPVPRNEKSVRGKQKVQNNIKVFCPKCNSKVSHTAEGIQLDQTKIIVAKVYNYFEQEYEELKKTIEGIDQTPLSKFRQRTALATGVSETMVEEIMQEEARRNEDMPQQTLQRQSLARKRPRQTDRSIEDGSSDENIANDDDETQTLVIKEAPVEPYNEEPEIFVALSNVKQEPGVFGDNQELTDPIAIEVKTEPRDEEETNESTKASTTEVQTITSRKRKKTNAQKCREYRERKKLQNTMVQNITAERSDECGETDQLPAKKPKTDAERRKKYYEAQKLKKQKSKKIPKTAKQRNKECYDRKKKLQALNTLNHHSDVSNETTAVQRATKGFKKIKTERNTDGPPAASAPPATSAPPAPPATSAPLERKMMPLEDFEVKMEKIEIGEEGFS